MKEQHITKILIIFYIFCFVCLVVGGVKFYNIKIEQKNRLLKINDKVDIKDVGESIKLELSNNNKNEEVIYKIENEDVAKIDENGVLVGIGEGTTKVTVTNKDESKTQTFVVNVGETAIKEYEKTEDKIPPSNSNNNSSNTSNNSNINADSNNNSSNNDTSTSNTNNDSTNDSNNSSDSTNNSTNSSSNNNNSDSNNTSNNSNNNSGNSNNTSSNNNANNSNNNTNKTIKVTGVSLNKSSAEIYLNSSNKTTSLTATVMPTNATNKSITWSSSNTNVATVNNGIVTAINPGVATISVKTVDGNYVASTSIIVKKKVIIIIGASQVTRMERYKTNYSSTKYNYTTSNGTLVYVQKGGSGIDYQTNEGLAAAKKIMATYNDVKNQVYFYIYFPLSGNTIRKFTCGQISTSNSSINQYAKNYNDAVISIRNNGYNVNGYVVSMHPVKTTQSSSDKVVSNQNDNSCKADYRSNWKYYKFNLAIESIIKSNYGNISYEELFTKIMNVNDDKKNFSFKITYNTDDGVHWDSATTKAYVDMMLNTNNNL